MFVSWSLLRSEDPSATCPWMPAGSVFVQAGHAAGAGASMPTFDGRSWSVLAIWDDVDVALDAVATSRQADGVTPWHVLLEPVSYHGDAVLTAGAQPFASLPPRGRVDGAAAVITLAGLGPDPSRATEFFERFSRLGQDVREAPGARAALVQAPDDGAVLTFSAWETLRDAVTWAYHRPTHAATVARQAEHGLLTTTGFLRCAVRASSGTLEGHDPLSGLTGRPAPTKETR